MKICKDDIIIDTDFFHQNIKVGNLDKNEICDHDENNLINDIWKSNEEDDHSSKDMDDTNNVDETGYIVNIDVTIDLKILKNKKEDEHVNSKAIVLHDCKARISHDHSLMIIWMNKLKVTT